MPTNQQRREAERRRLQRQLEERRARQAARKRMTFIISIGGTLVVIAAVVIAIVATTGGSGKKNPPNAGGAPSATTSAVPSPTPTHTSTTAAPPVPLPAKSCAAAPKGTKAKFEGVTVKGGTDLKHGPTVTSLSQTAPATLQCEDLVVGKGKPATASSTVSVQYTGVLYKNGTLFDSSWTNNKGKPVQFPLSGVVAGFKQGIGGAGKVAPMRVGGRRLMILPAALGYGAQANGSIPANSPLVFIVDLVSVTG